MSRKGQNRRNQPTVATVSKRVWIALAILAILALFYWSRRQSAIPSTRASAVLAPGAAGANTTSAGAGSFLTTTANHGWAPGAAPAGMVWIPGGEFSMGANDPPDMDEVGTKATLDARPIHRVYVDGFYMDKTDVTNAEFAKFVKATGYVTVAERKPQAEAYPGAPPENLVTGWRVGPILICCALDESRVRFSECL